MDTHELRQRLAAILMEEEREVVDWTAVNEMLNELNDDLTSGSPECPHFVHHFISDSDIRAKDNTYGEHQRLEVKRFVETGDFKDGKALSSLGCVALVAALGGLAFWLN